MPTCDHIDPANTLYDLLQFMFRARAMSQQYKTTDRSHAQNQNFFPELGGGMIRVIISSPRGVFNLLCKFNKFQVYMGEGGGALNI